MSIGKTTETTASAPVIQPVESDLFSALPGEWTATMTGRIGGDGADLEISFPVTIAAGADEQTALDYRAQNRLVCLRFNYDGQMPYFSPADLLAGTVPGLDYNPWDDNEKGARQDYGPKWFLEIAADGSVSVPADDESSFHYLKYYQNYLIGMSASGAYYLFGKEFDVEVATDGKTLTVKGFEADGEVYYPSVIFDNYGEYGIDFQGTSDIVLKRTDTGAAVKTSSSFRSDRMRKSVTLPVDFVQKLPARRVW